MVDVSNLQNVLRKMGLILTDEEKEELLKTLPIYGEDLAHPLKLGVVGLCVKTAESIYLYVQYNLFRKQFPHKKKSSFCCLHFNTENWQHLS